MKPNPKKMATAFLIIMGFVTAFLVYDCSRAHAQVLPTSALTSISFVEFPGIPGNVSDVDFKTQTITMHVDKSKSFAVIPLHEETIVKTISFFWKSQGPLKRSYSDNRLAVGLVLSGARSLWNRVFTPQWMELIDEDIGRSFNEMVFLNVGDTPAEYVWNDPEYRNVRHITLPDYATHWEGDWRYSKATFSSPYKIVGFVILADGENTKSQFVSTIKDLAFE